jgi:hypothetical protein
MREAMRCWKAKAIRYVCFHDGAALGASAAPARGDALLEG